MDTSQINFCQLAHSSNVYYLINLQMSIRVPDLRSILKWLYSPVEITSNMSMIDILVLGGP